MDWTDKLTMAAIIGLSVITVGFWGHHEIGKKAGHNNAGEVSGGNVASAAQEALNKQIYSGVRADKEKKLYSDAMSKLQNIMKQYPRNPLSYVYLAQLELEQGRLADAVHSYRRAVEMEPDYVDKKAPGYMGEEIKTVVIEGMEKFEREKELKPKDRDVQKALKDVYYLQRRLAGGCE